MNQALLLLSSALLGGVAGALTGKLLDEPDVPRGETHGAGPEARNGSDASVAALEKTISELRTRLNALDEKLAQTQLAPAPVSARAPELSQDALEQAIASYMEKNGRAAPAAEHVPSTPSDGETSVVASASLTDLMDMLSGDFDGVEEEELWEEIRNTGRMDEVLAEYERLAKLQPDNPDVQAALGTAYIQKIFDVGSGPLAGKFGTLADEAYDRALEADPEHWVARFSKAVSLSNWPEFLGKAPEAIRQFEILIEQQEHQTTQPHFAQTYFILGNMQLKTGKREKALEVWRRGLALFPDDEELREQIRLNE